MVVVDNDGGAIFSFLPQAGQLSAAEFETLFGTPHGLDLVQVARAHGAEATSVATRADLRAAVQQRGRGIRVRVVRTDRQANVAAHQALQDAVAAALRRRE